MEPHFYARPRFCFKVLVALDNLWVEFPRPSNTQKLCSMVSPKSPSALTIDKQESFAKDLFDLILEQS